MDQIVKIGDYEFVTSPGVVLHRKINREQRVTGIVAVYFLVSATHYATMHKWALAIIEALVASLSAFFVYKNLGSLPDQTELIAERDGRWVVRGEDAGDVEGASVLVKTSRGRHLVSLSCRDRDKPHLVWWTLKRNDAERLKDLIETVLPTRAGSGVWPPAPSLHGGISQA